MDERGALRAFEGHNWENELAHFDPQEEGHTCCAAGIGFHDDNYSFILHICPRDKETVLFHLHYKQPRSLFGLFRRLSDQTHTVELFPLSRVRELIRSLFQNDLEKILSIQPEQHEGGGA